MKEDRQSRQRESSPAGFVEAKQESPDGCENYAGPKLRSIHI